ncbi:PepSY domain-containing protein [Neisseria weaveri]|uniref:Peptidase propeptide and YPEB domain n=1 Tax=Neisseria weaveri TaxID=28091 RepID=A0A448VPJ5_9NEIS|nr:PepSY domain-containing protein [Neisseria weaveri]EGV37898.1 hypothetical protein l11_08500 [Neisseria weaveri LMG 5135]SAY50279.1 Peptidase propeptide and YPEB domain [Neisseria weaveri]VEJ51683.1 Peptidase propeptide and YPEB domain [Neisseria weaveri]
MKPNRLIPILLIVATAFTANAAQAAQYISSKKAVAIAQKNVKGQVTDVDFDSTPRAHYEVDILSKGHKYEIEIDARTGKILSKRVDRDD